MIRRPWRGLVTGRLPRLLLIQSQYLKKELLIAMQAMDNILQANKMTLQFLSLSPTILKLWAGHRLYRALLLTPTLPIKKRIIFTFNGINWANNYTTVTTTSQLLLNKSVRDGLREIEKLLYISRGFNNSTQYNDITAFTAQELGKMLSILHRLQILLIANEIHVDCFVLKHLQVTNYFLRLLLLCIYYLINFHYLG